MGTVLKFAKSKRRLGTSQGNPKRKLRIPRIEGLLLLGGLLIAALVMGFGEATERVPHTSFGLCDLDAGPNCVIDGDTFRLNGDKIRIADIDTPETHPARCQSEALLGAQATRRLLGLLNDGPFELRRGLRDQDRYGRKLRTVMRDGDSLGQILVAEGLARPWTGHRRSWCG